MRVKNPRVWKLSVISFYDRRFHIGFTAQEIADLKAFLQTL